MRERILLFLFFSLVFFACKKFETVELESMVSSYVEDESHNQGKNCMDCHYSAGSDVEGVFTLAGTVYGNTSKSTIELYNSKTGVLVRTIEVDRLGNAYTTQPIDFSEGLIVGVRNQRGKIEYMDDKIFSGQCNLCHGTGIEGAIEID